MEFLLCLAPYYGAPIIAQYTIYIIRRVTFGCQELGT